MYIIWCSYICLLLIWPMLGLMLKGWQLHWTLAFTPLAISTYTISFKLATVATIINLLLGSAIAWTFARYEIKGKKWFQMLIEMPMILPTSVIGVILADLYGKQGWVGRYLTLAYSEAGMCLAMMVVSLPLVVRTMQPMMEELEREMEEASWCLGASSLQTFIHAIWPNLAPAVWAATGLTWSRCVGEYGAIMMISSNLPYKDLATSVFIASLVEQDDEGSATLIALTMMFMCVAILLLLEFQWRIKQF
uniref:Sulfate transport system permease protein n=1 Tax=Cyanidiococcus yangmingshanensis TaxID=2690220 RepID=A0A7G5VUW5_9RHOD|nr:sulfate transport system permease protein [Cyanidiococcus yangmingshanensis]QMX77482.1 sulfate transport system permease protein [Cyanidiococcus yangmingshanensis]UNJ15919.1 sulfate transport protein [Cyanidioschyzonaceae sp. 3]WDB00391.1 sulfate transport system permease protein [Cyanidiococcus yangmingshanensis]